MDVASQPRYPFKVTRCDATIALRRLIDYGLLETHFGAVRLAELSAIHASPPCQAFTAYNRTGNVGDYPDLIEQTRELLDGIGLPYVIENVVGAPLDDPVLICGTMFDPPMDIQRHRLFETNWPLEPPAWPCRHKLNGRDRFPGGRSKERTGSSRGLVRATVEVGSWDIPLTRQQEAMGIDWMELEELSEAIPPAYCEFVGAQLLAHLRYSERAQAVATEEVGPSGSHHE